MSGKIWVQAVWHSDRVPERIFGKFFLKDVSRRQKIMKNYACKELNYEFEMLTFLSACDIFCRLLLTFASSLVPDQGRQNV